MQGLTEDGRRIVESVASRHGFSADAATQLLLALSAGGGWQAQFNHPEFGGMGQWSSGGMIMIGDMFNNGLKYRVDALCNDLAAVLRDNAPFAPAPMPQSTQSQSQGGYGQSQSSGMGSNFASSLFVQGSGGNRWPAELGAPSSSGSQNDLHYAVFPNTRRLAIQRGGQTTVYDIGDHQIGGFSQQQGGDQSLTFTSQFGLIRVADLPVVSLDDRQGKAQSYQAEANFAAPPAAAPLPDPFIEMAVSAPAIEQPVSAAPGAPGSGGWSDDEIFSRIERLAGLHDKGIISQSEFETKKTELLARL